MRYWMLPVQFPYRITVLDDSIGNLCIIISAEMEGEIGGLLEFDS